MIFDSSEIIALMLIVARREQSPEKVQKYAKNEATFILPKEFHFDLNHLPKATHTNAPKTLE